MSEEETTQELRTSNFSTNRNASKEFVHMPENLINSSESSIDESFLKKKAILEEQRHKEANLLHQLDEMWELQFQSLKRQLAQEKKKQLQWEKILKEFEAERDSLKAQQSNWEKREAEWNDKLQIERNNRQKAETKADLLQRELIQRQEEIIELSEALQTCQTSSATLQRNIQGREEQMKQEIVQLEQRIQMQDEELEQQAQQMEETWSAKLYMLRQENERQVEEQKEVESFENLALHRIHEIQEQVELHNENFEGTQEHRQSLLRTSLQLVSQLCDELAPVETQEPGILELLRSHVPRSAANRFGRVASSLENVRSQMFTTLQQWENSQVPVDVEELGKSVQTLSKQVHALSASVSTTKSRRNPKRERATSKDIDKALPQIIDEIYTSLILKTKAQQMTYAKDRDDTISQHKEKIRELSNLLHTTTSELHLELQKKTKGLIQVRNLVEHLKTVLKQKEEQSLTETQTLRRIIQEQQDHIEKLSK